MSTALPTALSLPTEASPSALSCEYVAPSDVQCPECKSPNGFRGVWEDVACACCMTYRGKALPGYRDMDVPTRRGELTTDDFAREAMGCAGCGNGQLHVTGAVIFDGEHGQAYGTECGCALDTIEALTGSREIAVDMFACAMSARKAAA